MLRTDEWFVISRRGARFALSKIERAAFEGEQMMVTTLLSPNKSSIAHEIEHSVFAIVNAHDHFLGQARRFDFIYRDGVLVVRGHVPSYYLKEVLERVLDKVDGVHLIDNQVTVSSIERDDMVLF